MSDLEFNQAKPPEEDKLEEAASQAFESAEAGLEEVVEPVVKAAEQAGEESAALVGEVIDTAEEAVEGAGETAEKAAEEIESAWQPEEVATPVEFSAVSSEPVIVTPEPEIPPPSPSWTPEPPPAPEPPKEHIPPVPPPPPSRPVAEAMSADDERTWALLAHLSVLLNLVTGFLGPVAAIVIYFAFKDRSRFVRYHAMQSFLFQLLAWIGGGILTFVLWAITIPLLVVIVGLCLIPFALLASLIPLAALVYGVIGGIQVSQGQDFRYWLVGDWVRNELTGN